MCLDDFEASITSTMAPIVAPCGHTLCRQCLSALCVRSGGPSSTLQFTCPLCKRVAPLRSGELPSTFGCLNHDTIRLVRAGKHASSVPPVSLEDALGPALASLSRKQAPQAPPIIAEVESDAWVEAVVKSSMYAPLAGSIDCPHVMTLAPRAAACPRGRFCPFRHARSETGLCALWCRANLNVAQGGKVPMCTAPDCPRAHPHPVILQVIDCPDFICSGGRVPPSHAPLCLLRHSTSILTRTLTSTPLALCTSFCTFTGVNMGSHTRGVEPCVHGEGCIDVHVPDVTNPFHPPYEFLMTLLDAASIAAGVASSIKRVNNVVRRPVAPPPLPAAPALVKSMPPPALPLTPAPVLIAPAAVAAAVATPVAPMVAAAAATPAVAAPAVAEATAPLTGKAAKKKKKEAAAAAAEASVVAAAPVAAAVPPAAAAVPKAVATAAPPMPAPAPAPVAEIKSVAAVAPVVKPQPAAATAPKPTAAAVTAAAVVAAAAPAPASAAAAVTSSSATRPVKAVAPAAATAAAPGPSAPAGMSKLPVGVTFGSGVMKTVALGTGSARDAQRLMAETTGKALCPEPVNIFAGKFGCSRGNSCTAFHLKRCKKDIPCKGGGFCPDNKKGTCAAYHFRPVSVCTRWQSTGTCSYGDECTFLHCDPRGLGFAAEAPPPAAAKTAGAAPTAAAAAVTRPAAAAPSATAGPAEATGEAAGVATTFTWQCPVCTLENDVLDDACQVCETQRPSHVRSNVATRLT